MMKKVDISSVDANKQMVWWVDIKKVDKSSVDANSQMVWWVI